MELTLPYAALAFFVREHGKRALIDAMNAFYPQYSFYAMSEAWIETSRYVCKLRGVNGDCVIAWT